MKFKTSVEIEIDADSFRAAGAYLDGVCARISSHAVPPGVDGVKASVVWLNRLDDWDEGEQDKEAAKVAPLPAPEHEETISINFNETSRTARLAHVG
jgi:hypothetical protein